VLPSGESVYNVQWHRYPNCSGGFRPRLGGCSYQGTALGDSPRSSMIFAKITRISDFFVFPNCRAISKWANLQLPLNVYKTKSVSAFPIMIDTRGSSCPWTPLEALSRYPRYRLALPRSPWGRAPRYCRLEPPLPNCDKNDWLIDSLIRQDAFKNWKLSS